MRWVTSVASFGYGMTVMTSPTCSSCTSSTAETTTWLPVGIVGSMEPESTVSGAQPSSRGTTTSAARTASSARSTTPGSARVSSMRTRLPRAGSARWRAGAVVGSTVVVICSLLSGTAGCGSTGRSRRRDGVLVQRDVEAAEGDLLALADHLGGRLVEGDGDGDVEGLHLVVGDDGGRGALDLLAVEGHRGVGRQLADQLVVTLEALEVVRHGGGEQVALGVDGEGLGVGEDVARDDDVGAVAHLAGDVLSGDVRPGALAGSEVEGAGGDRGVDRGALRVGPLREGGATRTEQEDAHAGGGDGLPGGAGAVGAGRTGGGGACHGGAFQVVAGVSGADLIIRPRPQGTVLSSASLPQERLKICPRPLSGRVSARRPRVVWARHGSGRRLCEAPVACGCRRLTWCAPSARQRRGTAVRLSTSVQARLYPTPGSAGYSALGRVRRVGRGPTGWVWSCRCSV